MQRNSNGRTEPEKTTETALGRCLVEGDAATKVRDRRRRREALGISFAVEFVLLAMLIAAPLMNSVAQPHFNAVSFMPIAFGGSHKPHESQRPPAGNRHQLPLDRGLKFFTDKAPQPPAHRSEGENDPPILNSDLFPGLSNQDAPLMAGLRPSNAAVLPPVEKNKLEQKRPMKISEPVLQAQLISRLEPRYPPLALQTRKEGTVLLHAIISRDGRITALEVVSGSPWFAQAALEAVRQWRYRPTILNGEPVEVETSITVIFRLSP